MRLNESRPQVEVSPDLEEQFFSIEDQGMIFDILRNKLYSNPILAICREITSNARDAHREVGTPEVPVQITLPNNLEEYYKVKDFGPGISPDRMVNIFIKYTASTKRNDNLQTGGFGLGAKTPFAYSDSFTVTTVFNGVKYSYSCFIDSTRVGKMSLMHQAPTTEPNGTEIAIAVKNQDFQNFAIFTEQACRHWDVKPTIKGNAITWQTFNKIFEGNKWAIATASSWQKDAKMIIDGIEYPLELTTLKTYADSGLIDAARGHFILYFGVGELSLSASREQIYLDKPTQEKIRNRLRDIKNEIKNKVDQKIDSFPNLWEANVFYRKELNSVFSDIKFLGKLAWRGTALSEYHTYTNAPTFVYTKGRYSHRRNHDPNKISRGSSQHIVFEEKSALYINDLPLKEPTPRHVKKAFDSDPTLKSLQLICPTDKVTLADLNRSIHLDKMEPKLLSSITKASARAYTPPTSRLLIFNFDPTAAAFRQVSYEKFDEDNQEKVICLLVRENVTYSTTQKVAILDGGKKIKLDSLRTLLRKFPKVSLYGIDAETPKDRIKKDFGEFATLDEFIDENVVNNKDIDYIKIKFATTYASEVDSNLIAGHERYRKLITDPKSPFTKRMDLHLLISNLNKGDLGLLHIYESIYVQIEKSKVEEFLNDNPALDIKKVNEEADERYPLLPVVKTAYSYRAGDLIGHISD